MDSMTPEKALEIVSKINGKDGIDSLKAELENQIKQRSYQISTIQGETNAFKILIRMLDALKSRWGLIESDKQIASEVSKESGVSSLSDEMQEEVKKRLQSGICTFKGVPSRGGKWCSRKLSSKEEKSCGYCKVHMKELNLGEFANESEEEA